MTFAHPSVPHNGRMGRRLPPLSQLRAFEAAARHLSFKQAAAELHVTPTAISHQIRKLEDWLQRPLFERHTRQVMLTGVGQLLLPVLKEGFDAFALALESAAQLPAASQVTLSATPGFVSFWLLPRLGNLRSRHPHIHLQIHASTEVARIDEGEVDLAVRYGRAAADGDEPRPLAVERFAPVASPRLRLRRADDLRRYRLIHYEWRRVSSRTPTWARWLALAGIEHPDAQGGLRFNDESHAVQAAIAGEGVVLAGQVLVQDLLTRGLLDAPLHPALDAQGYFLLRSPRSAPRPAVQQVGDWLAEQFLTGSGRTRGPAQPS